MKGGIPNPHLDEKLKDIRSRPSSGTSSWRSSGACRPESKPYPRPEIP